jgi:hypothetical protein
VFPQQPIATAVPGTVQPAFPPAAPGFVAEPPRMGGGGRPPLPRSGQRAAAAAAPAFAVPPLPEPEPPAFAPVPDPALSNGASDVDASWHAVFEDFVRIKRDCGEAVEGFTFERFTATLRKNRDALMRQHGVHRVHFSAYMKEGRAALKAKPVRD